MSPLKEKGKSFSPTYNSEMIVGAYGLISKNLFRNILGQLADAMPQAITVTPEEREAIQRVSSPFSLLYEETV